MFTPTINGPGIFVTGESKKPTREKVISGGTPEEKRKITETIKGLGHKVAEKIETNVKTFDEQLKELRKIAKDKIARSANYITAGVIACAAVGITATVGELLRLGLPQNALELAFAAGVALIGYGFGKAAGVHEMDEEIKNLEKAGSAKIKKDLERARSAKIKEEDKDEVKPDKSMIIKLGKSKDEKD